METSGSERLFLGVEIGGTKLQLGVGRGDGSPLAALARRAVDADRGAAGILAQIQEAVRPLRAAYDVEAVGVGFGGPVRAAEGRVITSHQVSGWREFPLAEWFQRTLGLPAVVGNDCDAAAVAEARFGSGRGARIVFYVTVGTGVGGGLVVDGRLHGAGRPAAAEIGHLRPGLEAADPQATVESIASGLGIAAAARRELEASGGAGGPLRARCGGDPRRVTARDVAEAAAAGDPTARRVWARAIQALGWAVAQTITLTAAETVVVGGGVSLAGPARFFQLLRRETARYVFPPLADAYRIEPAALGQTVVVHGALALAAERFGPGR